MKQVRILVVLAAGLSGCSSVQQPSATKPESRPGTQMEPLLMLCVPPVPITPYDRLAAELRVVGAALQKYSRDHNGQLPPRLTALVSGSYLPASALISRADPTGGKEGGVPNSYSTWSQAAETDEAGSSFLYEFSEAPCKWDWISYLGDKPSPADVDTNRDGTVSWSEIKSWQMLHGDTVQQPKNRPYAKNRFPVVRCFWHQYPDAYADAAGRTTLNLAADLQTVFVSHPWWEKDP